MFFQKDIETMDRPSLERLQLEKLRRLARYCYDRVPFYRQKMDDAGVDPDKIRTLSDLQYLPLTTKEDIRDHYPTGLFAQPMKSIVRIHASSGTTGKPTVVGYTKNDLDMWSDCVARVDVLDAVHDIAVIRITLENYHGANYVDFHALKKDEEGWKIMAKVFTDA